jgi:hypothetical protein
MFYPQGGLKKYPKSPHSNFFSTRSLPPTGICHVRALALTRNVFCRSDARGIEIVQLFRNGNEIMRITNLNQISGILALAAMLCVAETASAQNAAAPSALKTIGAPTAAAKPEIVPSLFVLNSRGATLQGDTLTLTGVTPSSIIFADRPVRSAGHQPTADVIAEWGSGDDSFTKNPPNATLSVFGKDGVKDAVVVLKNPKLEGDKLTFNVQILEGDIAGADGGAALFIDIIGRPFTPMSFAGVARRSAFRGAMYAGAVGAAAYGAAAYAAPYAYAPPPPVYPYARPACGYYPYPPCY